MKIEIEIPFTKWKIGIRKVPPRIDVDRPWKCFFQDENGNITDKVPLRKRRSNPKS